MSFIKKYYNFILAPAYFILTFILSTKPLRDFDIWFHVKSGEVIAHKGIIHYDVFSYNTTGREWFPYEWLFQVWAYFQQQIFGFESLKYIVSFAVLAQQVLIYIILRRFFKIEKITSLILCFFFFVSTFEYYTARPHIIAYALLLATLFCIFEYYFNSRWQILILTIPVIFIWDNMHGSVFLSPFLFFSYSFICLFRYVIRDGSKYLKKAKIFFIFGILNSLVSILPPLGITQYRLLWYFWQNRVFISHFIEEWTPLIFNEFAFIYFTTSVTITAGFFIFVIIKTKKIKESLWLLPLLIFPPLGYSASRNVFLAYFTLTFMLGFSICLIWRKGKVFYILACLAGVIFIIIHIYFLSIKLVEIPMYYPVHAVEFLKKYHINGRMFNEYAYGGYILYQLYPEYKVFYDGRTDLYLQREMPDVLNLTIKKNEDDKKYKLLLDALWKKYNISFLMLRTEKHSEIRKIFNILSNDPNWSLVFWDDYTQIFVRRDGKNDAIIKEFGAQTATPYEVNPYRTGEQNKALQEYQRMTTITNSSKSRNAIGYILLQKGDILDAQKEFEAAIAQYPLDESPFMNLAEIAVHNGDLDQAILLYKRAQNLAPDRGLIYLRLGQIILQKTADINLAKQIWKQGVENTSDLEAKNTLKTILQR